MSLRSLHFDNRWARLPAWLHHRQPPATVAISALADVSPMALAWLNVESGDYSSGEDDRRLLVELASGASPPAGLVPLAQRYAGHQYGVFNPYLGDGRALLLGEAATALGPLELSLKGSGITPFSHQGDGKLGLRGAVREYLLSHALRGLGVPTALGLGVLVHEERIVRRRLEHAATLVRVTPSHMRVGHFEWCYHRGRHDLSRLLLELLHQAGFAAGDAETFYAGLVSRCADLVAAWQAVGFVHGTLNTDNVSVLGLTLDHGTGVFMESYRPDLAPAREDGEGRFAYHNQPEQMHFALAVMAQCLTPLVPLARLRAQLDRFQPLFRRAFRQRLGGRLGLIGTQPGDGDLIGDWLALLQRHGADYCRAFRALIDLPEGEAGARQVARQLGCHAQARGLVEWLIRYRQRRCQDEALSRWRHRLQLTHTPVYVCRWSHLKQVADAAEEGDYQPLGELRRCLSQPFEPLPGFEHWLD